MPAAAGRFVRIGTVMAVPGWRLAFGDLTAQGIEAVSCWRRRAPIVVPGSLERTRRRFGDGTDSPPVIDTRTVVDEANLLGS
jgi:hypothetical protein